MTPAFSVTVPSLETRIDEKSLPGFTNGPPATSIGFDDAEPAQLAALGRFRAPRFEAGAVGDSAAPVMLPSNSPQS